MEKKPTQHPLSLKVIRLTRPSLYTTLPLICDSRDLPGDLFKEDLDDDLGRNENLEMFNTGNLLLLPQSFGNIYLGETFSCFMSVHNDGSEKVNDITFRAELHTGTQNIPLTGQANGITTPELDPNQNIDEVIHHEVKETGNHFLVCKVTYTSLASEPRSFSKNFRFQVLKPLDVKTKFYNAEDYLSDEVYLEAQLQNLISVPIFLEKVSLEPSSHFTVRQLNSVDCMNMEKSVFGEVNCLKSMDSRQYLFCMIPRPEVRTNVKILKGITGIGKLDIVWRTSMGERGRLQTSQLERMAPGYGDIRLTVEQIPSIVTLEKPFTVGFRVLNSCERVMDLQLAFDNNQTAGLLWEGISGRQLGKLESHATIDISLTATPVKTGLQSISGLRLCDVFLQRTYNYDDIAQVFVSPEDIIT